MFAVAFARRPRRVVKRLVALDGAVALAAAGGWVAFVVAAAGAVAFAVAAAAAAPLGVLPAASLDDVAPAAASQDNINRSFICETLATKMIDMHLHDALALLNNRPSVHVTL